MMVYIMNRKKAHHAGGLALRTSLKQDASKLFCLNGKALFIMIWIIASTSSLECVKSFVLPIQNQNSAWYRCCHKEHPTLVHVPSILLHAEQSSSSSSSSNGSGSGANEEKKKNLYELLGAKPSDSQDMIKKKYLSLASKLHPDSGNKEADSTRFSDIVAAWDVLKDEKERLRYDRELKGSEFAENFANMVEFGIDSAIPFFQKTADTTRIAVEQLEKTREKLALEQKRRSIEQRAEREILKATQLEAERKAILKNDASTRIPELREEGEEMTPSQALRIFEKLQGAGATSSKSKTSKLSNHIQTFQLYAQEYKEKINKQQEKKQQLQAFVRKQEDIVKRASNAQQQMEKAKNGLESAQNNVEDAKRDEAKALEEKKKSEEEAKAAENILSEKIKAEKVATDMADKATVAADKASAESTKANQVLAEKNNLAQAATLSETIAQQRVEQAKIELELAKKALAAAQQDELKATEEKRNAIAKKTSSEKTATKKKTAAEIAFEKLAAATAAANKASDERVTAKLIAEDRRQGAKAVSNQATTLSRRRDSAIQQGQLGLQRLEDAKRDLETTQKNLKTARDNENMASVEKSKSSRAVDLARNMLNAQQALVVRELLEREEEVLKQKVIDLEQESSRLKKIAQDLEEDAKKVSKEIDAIEQQQTEQEN